MSLIRSGRVMVYPNEIAVEDDILRSNMYRMVDVSMLAQALIGNGFGLADCVAGLACTPTSPASLSVHIAPGTYYSYQQFDATAYSSIPSDTTDSLYKQYVQYTIYTQTGFVVPGSGTNYYLLQAIWTTTDQNASNSRPYFNSNAPNTPQFITNPDTRQDFITFSLKLSTSSTPTPDAGHVGLYAITIPSGSTVITSGMISVYPGAPFINPSIFNAVTNDQLQKSAPIYAADSGAANAMVATPSPAYNAFVAGSRIFVKAANNNTGSTTLNISSLGAATVQVMTEGAFANLIGGEIIAGAIYEFMYTGSTWELLNPSNITTYNQLQQSIPIYAADSGAANAIVVTPSPAYKALVAGSRIYIKVANTNTGATTINVSSLGATACKKLSSAGISAFVGDELIANYIYEFIYDGTEWLLMGEVVPNIFAVLTMSAQQSLANDSTDHLINFNTVVSGYDPWSITNTTNKSITAPIPGLYEINSAINYTFGTNTTGSVSLDVYKNASFIFRIGQNPFNTSTDNFSIEGGRSLILAANDIITIEAINTGAGGAVIIGNNSNSLANCWFEVKYKGN